MVCSRPCGVVAMRSVKETFGKRDRAGITSVAKSGRSKNTCGAADYSDTSAPRATTFVDSLCVGSMALKRKAVEGATSASRKKPRAGSWLSRYDVGVRTNKSLQQRRMKMYSWAGNPTARMITRSTTRRMAN